MRTALAMVMILTGGGCASQAFREAKNANTFDSYSRFLSEYPNHDLAKEARRLRENALFNQAVKENSIQAYETYLKAYPSGMYKNIAQEKMEDLTWEDAEKAHTVAGYDRYIRRYSKGKFISEALQKKESLIGRLVGIWVSHFGVMEIENHHDELQITIRDTEPPIYVFSVSDIRFDGHELSFELNNLTTNQPIRYYLRLRNPNQLCEEFQEIEGWNLSGGSCYYREVF